VDEDVGENTVDKDEAGEVSRDVLIGSSRVRFVGSGRTWGERKSVKEEGKNLGSLRIS
jgi:hypothetical protein